MKKALLVLLMAGVASLASAQVRIGPKVGLSASYLSLGVEKIDGIFIERSMVAGLNLGIAASFQIDEMFSFAPEVMYIHKGGKFSISDRQYYYGGTLDAEYEEIYRFNFVEVPLLFRSAFGADTKWYINAGPTLGYWLGGKVESTFIEHYQSGDQSDKNIEIEKGEIIFVDEYDFNDERYQVLKRAAKRLGVGASFGAGVLLPSNVMFDLRYTLSLDDLQKIDENEDAFNKFRTNTLSLSIAYLFGK